MVVHQYYYRDGRVQRYAESLASRGIEVDVLCPRDPNEPPAQRHPLIQVHPIRLSRGYQKRSNYLVEYAAALVMFTLKLTGRHLRRRYDVIHVHNMPDFLVFAALVPKAMGAKIVVDVHDVMPEFYMSKFGAGPSNPLVRFMKVQEQVSARLADRVITANDTFAERLSERGIPAGKITVINNFANTSLFDRSKYPAHQPGSTGELRLIYPGTIAPRYGLDIAVRALPKLISVIPEVKLVIIGSLVDHSRDLQALADRLGVADHLDLRGAIPNDEVPGELARADVGIYPALPDAHMNIATPTKVLEYAAMGLPVVTARLPVVERLLPPEAALWFEPGDAEALARQVIELYKDQDLRHRLVAAADAAITARHSWAEEADRYLGLLMAMVPTT